MQNHLRMSIGPIFCRQYWLKLACEKFTDCSCGWTIHKYVNIEIFFRLGYIWVWAGHGEKRTRLVSKNPVACVFETRARNQWKEGIPYHNLSNMLCWNIYYDHMDMDSYCTYWVKAIPGIYAPQFSQDNRDHLNIACVCRNLVKAAVPSHRPPILNTTKALHNRANGTYGFVLQESKARRRKAVPWWFCTPRPSRGVARWRRGTTGFSQSS